jgi:hypothetical protein
MVIACVTFISEPLGKLTNWRARLVVATSSAVNKTVSGL